MNRIYFTVATQFKGMVQNSHAKHRDKWCRFAISKKGNAAIMVGLSLPILAGFLGLGVEVGMWYMYKGQLQAQVDMAAWAGAHAKKDGEDDTAIILAATQEAQRNGWDSGDGTITITIPSPTAADSIEVVATQDHTLLFISLFQNGQQTVAARAVAHWEEDGGSEGPCIIALEESDSAALEFSGTVDMDLDCGIAVHSDDDKAFKISGDVFLDASDACIAGDLEVSGDFDFDDGIDIENASGITNGACTPEGDPLADVDEPEHDDDCDEEDFKIDNDNQNVTLSPGVYCNGIEISGSDNDITFEPGEYIIAGKGFKLSGSNNDVTGDGLFFYNTDNDGNEDFGDIDFSGSDNEVIMSGANPDDNGASGDAYVPSDYHGVLWFNNRSNKSTESGKKFKLAGELAAAMDGYIYMPNWQVEYSGQTINGYPCGSKIIGGTIHFNGNSSHVFESGNDCVTQHVGGGPTDLRVRLVE
jgi:Flp pilus assembly protein TadG